MGFFKRLKELGLPMLSITNIDDKDLDGMRGDNVTIHKMQFDDLPLSHYKDRLPLYDILVSSKFQFLKVASELYPDVDEFVWVDFGICHFDHQPKDEMLKVLQCPMEKSIFCILRFPTDCYELSDVSKKIINSPVHDASGQLLFIKRSDIDLCVTSTERVYASLTVNKCKEENIIPYIICNNRDRFNYRFTRYMIFSSFYHIRREFNYNMHDNLHQLKDIPNLLYQYINDIVESIDHGYITISDSDYAHFLYYAHLYTFHSHRSLSDRLANVIASLISNDKLHVSNKLLAFSNIRENIAYNNPIIDFNDHLTHAQM